MAQDIKELLHLYIILAVKIYVQVNAGIVNVTHLKNILYTYMSI
jgi:hypothetical protein